MTAQPKYPNLLIIGAMKCGTTSLHNYLDQHPDVFMRPNKEPNYFGTDSDEERTKRYKEVFAVDTKYCGESTINYSKCHEYFDVPKRIKKASPEVKLIYIVRDPIKRMESEFRHLKWRGDIDDHTNINEFFRNFDNTAIQTSNYYKQISGYLQEFRRDQILILGFEELNQDPKKLLKKVTDFLGISELKEGVELEKHNVTSEKVKPKRFLHIWV